MGNHTCDICSKTFEYDEVLSAHKTGHEKADAFLFQFYIDKIKPTEIRVIRRKRKSKKRATNEMPVLQAIEAPGAKGGPGSSRKPKRLGKRSLPSICSPKAAAKPGRTRPHTLEPANISPPENKRPKLLLNEPEPREGVPVSSWKPTISIWLLIQEYEIKLMECQNKRKAEKREMMGLPPLNPYYCKDFGSKDCCFRYSKNIFFTNLPFLKTTVQFTGLQWDVILIPSTQKSCWSYQKRPIDMLVPVVERSWSQIDYKNTWR